MKCQRQGRITSAGFFMGFDATAIGTVLSSLTINDPIVFDLLLDASNEISQLLSENKDNGGDEAQLHY